MPERLQFLVMAMSLKGQVACGTACNTESHA
jgi:hypothetical protein